MGMSKPFATRPAYPAQGQDRRNLLFSFIIFSSVRWPLNKVYTSPRCQGPCCVPMHNSVSSPMLDGSLAVLRSHLCTKENVGSTCWLLSVAVIIDTPRIRSPRPRVQLLCSSLGTKCRHRQGISLDPWPISTADTQPRNKHEPGFAFKAVLLHEASRAEAKVWQTVNGRSARMLSGAGRMA